MKRKIIAATVAVAILITAFILGVNGTVNLAGSDNTSGYDNLSESEKQAKPDRLCGVLITRVQPYEYFADKSEYNSESDSNEQKYYLDFEETIETNSETGETYTYNTPAFDDIDGYWFALTEESRFNGSPIDAFRGNAVSDFINAINYTDTGIEEEVEGTFYFADNGDININYINWLYQEPNGKIYAVPYLGMSVSNGSSHCVTFDETYTAKKTIGDISEVQTESLKVTLNLESVSAPVKTVILQFDSVGNIISRDEYTPESIPEELTVSEETEYIVTESFNNSEEPTINVKREIFGRDVDSFNTFVEIDNGVCEMIEIPIKWQTDENDEQVIYE